MELLVIIQTVVPPVGLQWSCGSPFSENTCGTSHVGLLMKLSTDSTASGRSQWSFQNSKLGKQEERIDKEILTPGYLG